MNKPYRIALVFDSNYGEKIVSLAETIYVWAINSTLNLEAAKLFWKLYSSNSYVDAETERTVNEMNTEHGVTIFDSAFDGDLLATLWEHHGDFAHNPPLSEILVIGLTLTDDVERTINDYDLSIIETGNGWFLIQDHKYYNNGTTAGETLTNR